MYENVLGNVNKLSATRSSNKFALAFRYIVSQKLIGKVRFYVNNNFFNKQTKLYQYLRIKTIKKK